MRMREIKMAINAHAPPMTQAMVLAFHCVRSMLPMVTIVSCRATPESTLVWGEEGEVHGQGEK